MLLSLHLIVEELSKVSQILVILTAIAGSSLTQQTQLNLPIPLPLTMLTVLLPLLTYFNTSFVHRLLFPGITMTHTLAPGTISPRVGLGVPLIVLQSVYTTVVLVMSLSYTSLSRTRHCLMENQWRVLFTARNAAAIRAIQETLECCGFAGTHDRSWPFPVERPTDPGFVGGGECERRTGWTRSCKRPWGRAEESAAVKLVIVGVVVALCQVSSPRLSQSCREEQCG